MQDYPTKVDGISTEPAAEYNNLTSELKRPITSLGLALSSGSITQLAEAIAIYAQTGSYCSDGGSANTYVLSDVPATKIPPTSYFIGMKFNFLPSNTNTGASTVNYEGLGVKNIILNDGSTALSGGEIVANRLCTLVYDGTAFRVETINSSTFLQGKIVQVVNFQTGALASGTGIINYDDSIPQNTEGDEYMTLAITPKNTSNKLLIEFLGFFGASSDGTPRICALFQDSTANALATGMEPPRYQTTIGQTSYHLRHYMTAGTTSSTTFKIRVGTKTGGTTYLNGDSGGRKFGGTYASSITITEIAV